MIKTASVKAAVAVACLGLVCASSLALNQANAIPYTHSEAQAGAGMGVVHIAVTLDCTATGGTTTAIWLPINHGNATVQAVLDEGLIASENKVDRAAHVDYDTQSLAAFLEGKDFEIAVYKDGAQRPGAEPVYTSDSIGDITYAGLVTGDAVYITVLG